MAKVNGISVVIPNYNGEKLLPEIIPLALKALENTGLVFEIIIVDDCSKDSSVELIKNDFTFVKCIVNATNSGFSVTANKGIMATKYEWVLLLNSDVKLEQDYFKHLLKYTTDNKVFAVMSRIVGWDDEIIQDGAKYPHFHGMKIKTSGNYLLEDESKMKDGLLSMYVSGANAFINKNIFIEIGGFNEMFSPYYVEDFELSLRAWRFGYVCYYDHQSICRHKVSSTIKSTQAKKSVNIIYNRNKMYLHAIHHTFPSNIFWIIQLTGEVIGRALLLQTSYVKSFSLFLKNNRKINIERRKLKSISKQQHLFSIKEVADKIITSVKNETIIRF